MDPDIRDLDLCQNLIICSTGPLPIFLKISCKSVWKLLHKVAKRQTDKQWWKHNLLDRYASITESWEMCLVSRMSWDVVFHVQVLAQSRHLHVFVLARVLSFRVSSCLTSHDCVLTMSLSGIAKCLFCAETLAVFAESRQLGPFTCCLPTYCKQLLFAVVAVLCIFAIS